MERRLKGRWATWKGVNLNHVAPEPFLVSLLKYRQEQDRSRAPWDEADLVSSRSADGSRRVILDLDIEHEYVPSTAPGHGHLFIDIPMSWWRWALLLVALRLAGVIETGFMVWSLRRGENFVRRPGIVKEQPLPPPQEYGWIFPRRRH